MAKRLIRRRHFLSGAGAAAAVAVVAGPAQGEGARLPGAPATPAADIVLRNGKIITIDPASSVTQAIAISGDRIVAVGPNDAMAPHTGPATRVVDLKGKAVIPGITDGHAHMDREGLRNVFPSLGRVRSIRDIQDRIAELARGRKPGEWIVTMPIGDPPYYFDVPDILAEKRWPTRQELDAAAPNNPVYIRSIWGFWRGTFPIVSCANTEALKRAGITRDTASPVTSLTIEKDGNGDPTGVFIEQEMQPITELLWFREATRFSHADRMKALQESQRLYHAVGTTSIFEGHGAASELIRVYKQTHQDGALSMRTTLAFSPDWLAAGKAPLGPFVDSWAAWLGEPCDRRRSPAHERRLSQPRSAAGRQRQDRGGGLLYRMGGFQLHQRTAAPAAQGSAGALRRQRHPRHHERPAGARPLRRGRPRGAAEGQALGDRPHQRLLAARTSSASCAWGWCSPPTPTTTSTKGCTCTPSGCRPSATPKSFRCAACSTPA